MRAAEFEAPPPHPAGLFLAACFLPLTCLLSGLVIGTAAVVSPLAGCLLAPLLCLPCSAVCCFPWPGDERMVLVRSTRVDLDDEEILFYGWPTTSCIIEELPTSQEAGVKKAN